MKTSRPGADTSPLDARTNGHLNTSMDANSSKGYDDPAHASSTSNQERTVRKRDMKKENPETDIETQKQTKKILEEFLKKTLEKKANAPTHDVLLKGESKNIHTRHYVKARVPVAVDRRTKSTVQRMKHETDQRKLEDLMSGRYRSPLHEVSHNVSMDGEHADTTDSGRLQRSGSFTKALRHSVVTELENQANANEVLRRRNSEGIKEEPSRQDDSLTESGNKSDKQLSSPISHNRASSDSVMVQCATNQRRHSPKKETKDKKSWLSKISFKKKREGHKLRSSKESVTPVEADIYGPPGTKIAKTPSDHHRRKTPSPPASPKRTPKFLRRFASIIKKESPPASKSNTPKRYQSFERAETVSEPANTDSKSNSLPNKVGLSTQVQHTSDPQHRVVLDGSYLNRKNKGDTQRPTTLDIPKKKPQPKLTKRIKRYFIAAPSSPSSSSSSSIASSSSAPDLTTTAYQTGGTITDGGIFEVPVGQPVPNRNEKDSKPSVSNVRGHYHHSASKSMSDMDSQEKSLSIIAAKLKSIADALQQSQYSGPAGRSQTPDSFYHDLQAKGDRSSGVNRSKSTPVTKATGIPLEAFRNAQKTYVQGADTEHSQSINGNVRREHQPRTENWSDKVESERRSTQRARSTHDRRQKQSSRGSSKPVRQESAGQNRRLIPHSSSSPERSVSRSPIPPLIKSTSPKVRGSRQSDVTTDNGSARRQVYRLQHYSQYTETVTTSPTGSITSQISFEYDVVQADVIPFSADNSDYEEEEPGLAVGFADNNEYDVRETPVTVRREDVELPSMEPVATRSRAQTYPVHRLDSELDNVDDDEERGAVGGEAPHNDVVDEKLVERLVGALRRRGDEINKEMDLDLGETMMNFAATVTEETFKMSLQKAISIVYDNVRTCQHPEVVQLAVIFEMASALRAVQPAVSRFFNSLINHIVSNYGGWSESLRNSIDETDEEMTSLNKDGTKSPHQDKDRHRKDDSDEVD